MHAGLSIFIWLIGVAALQFATPVVLYGILAVLIVIAWRRAPARCRRLFHKVRFLLLALFVLFAWFTPGEALLAAMPAFSPTWEGVCLAFEHAGRLAAVVCCVAILMASLPANRLVGGLYALMRPLAAVGLPSERIAVRVLLVLRYVEAPVGSDWRHWLLAPPQDDVGPIVVARERFSRWDLLWGMAAVVAVLMLLAWRGVEALW